MTSITPLYVPLVAISTLCAIVFIGLGFLRAPSRAAALWSIALLSAVVASHGWGAADLLESTELRAAASGLLLAPLALVWSGVRAYTQRPQHLAVSISWMVITPLVLGLGAFTDAFDLIFRLMFLLTGVFAALTIIELVPLRPLVRDEVLPMLTMSALFIVFTAIVILEGLIMQGQRVGAAAEDSLHFVRTINTASAVVYIVGITITMLLLARENRRAGPTIRSTGFQMIAVDRLQRAEAAQDPWWSLIDIRLDNPDEIRAMSGGTMFEAISDRLATDVRAVLPAEADIDRVSSVRFVALVPRAQGDVRTLLQNLLQCVARVEPDRPSPVRMTASVGWAQVSAVSYDLSELKEAAAQAAVKASADGGDRWERVGAED